MTKKIVETAIKEMPNEFKLDDLFERLVFVEKVEEGLREIEEGKSISLTDVREIMDGWRK